MSEAPSAGGRECVVLHAGALGDLVLSLRLVERVYGRGANPIRVTLLSRVDLGTERLGRLVIDRRSLDSIQSQWLYGSDAAWTPPRLQAAIEAQSVINFLSGVDDAVHRRVAFLRPRSLLSIDVRQVVNSERHITEQWATQAGAQGRLVPRCIYGERGASAASRRDGPTLIHAGSGGVRKCWPLPAYCGVAERLTAEGETVRFLLGPAELERWSTGTIEALRSRFPIEDDHTPASLAAALRAARAYIGNDSGVTHLAAALDTPTLAIFGPTDARVWRPLGAHVGIVRGSVSAGEDWGIAPHDVCEAMSALFR